MDSSSFSVHNERVRGTVTHALNSFASVRWAALILNAHPTLEVFRRACECFRPSSELHWGCCRGHRKRFFLPLTRESHTHIRRCLQIGFTRRTALDCMPRPPHLPFGGVGRYVPLSTRFMARLRTLQAPYLLRLPSFPASASVERPKRFGSLPNHGQSEPYTPFCRPTSSGGGRSSIVAIDE